VLRRAARTNLIVMDLVPSDLDVRERQVLRFTATFCAEKGHLPSAAEIAIGCGIGSPATATRALRALERRGLIERDPDYPRLARVTIEFPACRPELELALVEIAMHESRGNLDIVREALRWAPDADAIAFLHREGVARATLLRAYEEARARLRAQGVVLAPEVQQLVDGQQDVIRRRHARITGWDTYCVYSAAISLLARAYTTTLDQVGLPLLEPVWVSEALVYDGERRLDRAYAAHHSTSAEATALVAALVDDLSVMFSALIAPFPELTLPAASDSARVLDAVAELA
jgi:LexA DNA binding domain